MHNLMVTPAVAANMFLGAPWLVVAYSVIPQPADISRAGGTPSGV